MKTLEDLKALRDKMKANLDVRQAGDNENNVKIIVGMATCGIAAGARETFNAMMAEASALGLKNITFTQSGCMGSCYAEPTVEVTVLNQQPILYGNVTAEKGKEIIAKHIQHGELLQNLIIGEPFEKI
ncbi:MAG: (2Fe-2S) ferredoxin domain-containing protein [Hyphomonadaceae bacterium]|nr:(2Fe-2S) ferredoxin domain-containing protein [Clostridia bacterium]